METPQLFCTLKYLQWDHVIPVKDSHVVKGIGMPRIDIQSHSQMMEGLFTIFQQGCQVVMSQNVVGPQPIVKEHNDYWIISYELCMITRWFDFCDLFWQSKIFQDMIKRIE